MEHYDSDDAETSGQVRSSTPSAASPSLLLQPVVQCQSSRVLHSPADQQQGFAASSHASCSERHVVLAGGGLLLVLVCK